MTLPSRVANRPGAACSAVSDATMGSSIQMGSIVVMVKVPPCETTCVVARSGGGKVNELGRGASAEPHAGEGVDDVQERAGRPAGYDGKHVVGGAGGGVHLLLVAVLDRFETWAGRRPGLQTVFFHPL